MIKPYVSGTDNEKNIVKAINNQHFYTLNINLQNFIKELFPEISNNDILKANQLGGIYKRDFEIILNEKHIRN